MPQLRYRCEGNRVKRQKHEKRREWESCKIVPSFKTNTVAQGAYVEVYVMPADCRQWKEGLFDQRQCFHTLGRQKKISPHD